MASEETLATIQGRHAHTLTTLDLSSCRLAMRKPLHLDLLFCACRRLQRLDLSCNELPCAVLGSVLLGLPGLASLWLQSCSLAGYDVCCGEEGGDDGDLNGAKLWRRLTRLRTLSLADNPRMSGAAVASVVRALPSLTRLELASCDFWSTEVSALTEALTAAPALRSIGCVDSDWLDDDILHRLQGCAISVVLDRSTRNAEVPGRPRAAEPLTRQQPPRLRGASAAAGALAASVVVQEAVPEDWESIDLSQGLSPPLGPPAPAPAPSGSHGLPTAGRSHGEGAFMYNGVDYSRPPEYQQRPRSIYHVSQGSQPLYGELSVSASATTSSGTQRGSSWSCSSSSVLSSQTDANGLRS